MTKIEAQGFSVVDQSTAELVLIGGMPRSGTTLLTRLVSEDFGIPFSPETHYFTAAYSPEGALATERLPAEVMMDHRVAAAYENIKDQPRSVITFRGLLADILGQKMVLGEKTPAHLEHFEKILSEDEHTRCIIIVRGFYAITQSLKKVPWNSGRYLPNLKRCLKYWRWTYQLQKRFPGYVFVVHYEDLCADRNSVMEALSKKLPFGEGGSYFFDSSVEWWKKNVHDEPKEKTFEIFWLKLHEQFLAYFTYCICRMFWPLRFEKSRHV